MAGFHRIIGALTFVAALCGAAQAQTPVERGRYLAVLGDCAGCHDAPHGVPYAGGQSFSATFGKVYSSNITPDRETGIGTWSADDFYTALHNGVRPDGGHLYPAFPYPYFSRLSRADSDALFAFLRTQKPVHAAPPPNELHFPFNIRALMWFWDLFFLDAAPSAPYRTAQRQRGYFLVNGPGHCAACHTPKNALFGDEVSRAFTGGTVDNWYAANLTGARPDGLGNWTAVEISTYLKTGGGPHATAVGPMQDVIAHSTRLMTDQDRAAIAAYLKSLPAIRAEDLAPPAASQMHQGEAVFVNHCLICHKHTTPESLGGGPLLAHNTLVQGHNPQTVLRVILGGSQSIGLPNTPMPYSMPAFRTLDDADIAAVATYIRNYWGNRAPPVGPDDVRRLRKAIH